LENKSLTSRILHGWLGVILIAFVLAGGGCQNEATVQHGGREPVPSSRERAARPRAASVAHNDLSRLRSTHPRLLLTAEDFGRARAIAEGDPIARDWREKLRVRAVKLVSEPPLSYPRGALLPVSREAFLRIVLLAGSYRLTEDPRFSKRATEEMLAIAKFPDWGPKDFLATGEMTAAMSLGAYQATTALTALVPVISMVPSSVASPAVSPSSSARWPPADSPQAATRWGSTPISPARARSQRTAAFASCSCAGKPASPESR